MRVAFIIVRLAAVVVTWIPGVMVVLVLADRTLVMPKRHALTDRDGRHAWEGNDERHYGDEEQPGELHHIGADLTASRSFDQNPRYRDGPARMQGTMSTACATFELHFARTFSSSLEPTAA